MRFRFDLALITASTMLLASAPAFADAAPFTCPKIGTVEQRGVYIYKYNGRSSKDHYVCLGIDANDKPMRRLFNFYGPMYTKTPGLRDGMLALISGKETTVSFTLPDKATETWKFLRHEKVSLSGHTLNTLVFDHERHRHPNSMHPFQGHYTRWLDPAHGLWVQATLSNYQGEVALEAKPYTDTELTLPGQ